MAHGQGEKRHRESPGFRQVLKYYDLKQYKKGIKAADSFLKKHPDDGETLCMKGLLLNHHDPSRKEEAFELCRKGLRNDLKSYVCWHVFGLMYRLDQNYREAVKCYSQAFKLEKENQQILRDLSLMQAQIRDWQGHVETRRQLLLLKSNSRPNWLGFAVANHLNGSRDMAVSVLQQYESTLEDKDKDSEEYETSELILYRAQVLEEDGQLDTALAELDKNAGRIRDVASALEMKYRINLAKEKMKEAERCALRLLRMNPDDHGRHTMLLRSLSMDRESIPSLPVSERQKLMRVYRGLQQKFPRSHAPFRIPLDFLKGQSFKDELESYVVLRVRKGVPSLASDVTPLLSDPEKRKGVEEVSARLVQSLRERNTMPQSEAEESPAALLWALLFREGVKEAMGEFEDALALADEAIAHTPTCLDAYLAKARALESMGDKRGAAETAEEAREMDLADRNLNAFAVARLFRDGRPERASEVAQLFAREELRSGQASLHDMQCLWFEMEAGESHRRLGNRHKALWNFDIVRRHFADFEDDQFDFHQYCLRRTTLRMYVAMIRYQDDLRSHPYFLSAASSLVELYVSLHDRPFSSASSASEPSSPSEPSAESRSKPSPSEKKRKSKNKRAQQANCNGSNPSSSSNADSKEDREGIELASKPSPLDEASKLLESLQAHGSHLRQVHLAAFSVYWRKNRPLLALRALLRLRKVSPQGTSDPQAALCLIHLSLDMESGRASTSSAAGDILAEHVDRLSGGKPAKELAHDLAQSASSVVEHVAAAEGCLAVGEPGKDEVARNFFQGVCSCLPECTLEDALLARDKAMGELGDGDLAMRISDEAIKHFPRSSELRASCSCPA